MGLYVMAPCILVPIQQTTRRDISEGCDP